MIAVSPLVSLMIDSQNVLREVTELLLPHLPHLLNLISGGAKGGVAIVVVYCVFY